MRTQWPGKGICATEQKYFCAPSTKTAEFEVKIGAKQSLTLKK